MSDITPILDRVQQGDLAAAEDLPPLAHEQVRRLAALYLRYKTAGVPAELHIYSAAGHGFGLRESSRGAVVGWTARFSDWLGGREFLKKP